MDKFISLVCVTLLLLMSIIVLTNTYYVNKMMKRNLNTMTLLEHKEFKELKPYIKTFYEVFVVNKFLPYVNNEFQTFI